MPAVVPRRGLLSDKRVFRLVALAVVAEVAANGTFRWAFISGAEGAKSRPTKSGPCLTRLKAEPMPEIPPPLPFDGAVDGLLLQAKSFLDNGPGPALEGVAGEERLESIKGAVLSLISGALPLVFVSLVDPDRLTPRWEYQLDMLALDIALFGLVYRYAVREGDSNPMLRLGVLAAFALPRALFLVQLPPDCAAVPLVCGPPLGYFSWSMLGQAAWQFLTGFVALSGALYGLERGFSTGLVRRFGSSPPRSQAQDAQQGFKFPW